MYVFCRVYRGTTSSFLASDWNRFEPTIGSNSQRQSRCHEFEIPFFHLEAIDTHLVSTLSIDELIDLGDSADVPLFVDDVRLTPSTKSF